MIVVQKKKKKQRTISISLKQYYRKMSSSRLCEKVRVAETSAAGGRKKEVPFDFCVMKSIFMVQHSHDRPSPRTARLKNNTFYWRPLSHLTPPFYCPNIYTPFSQWTCSAEIRSCSSSKDALAFLLR